jgi:hypothetical protein
MKREKKNASQYQKGLFGFRLEVVVGRSLLARP